MRTLQSIAEALEPQAYTPQEAFDFMVEHLSIQREQCVGADEFCYYRLNGKKCAVGALLPDAVYAGIFEDHEARRGLTYLREGESEGDINATEMLGEGAILPTDEAQRAELGEVLIEMQKLHDNHGPEDWPGAFAALARQKSLSAEAVGRFFGPEVSDE